MRLYLWYITFTVFLSALITFSVWQSEQWNTRTSQRMNLALERIATLDNQIEENMLSFYLRRIRHFDQLNTFSLSIRQQMSMLEVEQGSALNQTHFKGLRTAVSTQEQAIDDFRRSMGILLNSEYYLPSLIEQLKTQQPQQSVWLSQVHADIFQWLMQKDDRALNQRIQQHLQQAKHNGQQLLAQHLELIIRHSQRAEYSMQQAIDCGIIENIRWLQEKNNQKHEALLQQYHSQRVSLLGLIAACLLYLLGLIISSHRTTKKLQAKNLRLLELEHQLMMDVAEKAQAEARYHTLLNTIPDSVGCHRDGRWLYLNQAAVKAFAAQSMDQLVATPVIERVHPDHHKAVQQRIQDVITQGQPAPLMMQRILRLDGSMFYGEVKATPFTDVDTKTSVLVVIRDVSSRVMAEEESRRLNAALMQTSEGVFITDQQGHIVYANQAFAEMNALNLETMMGRDIYPSYASNDIDHQAEQKFLQRTQHDTNWREELTVIDHQNQEHTILRKISPVVNDVDKITYYVGIDIDISEERELQRRMEGIQRLESLGVLTGGIAHDFNNILMAIMGNASLARMLLTKDSDIDDYLNNIEKSSERAADLCRQMLAYAGKGRLIIHQFNLVDLVNQMAELLQVNLHSNVRLQRHCDQNIPLIEGDSMQMQQIILNLIGNANESLVNQDGGQIDLRIEKVDLSDHQICKLKRDCPLETAPKPGVFVLLEVTDNGCGMDEYTRQHIFEPFFTTKFTGRGLGMSAVLGIIRSHQGIININTQINEGTRFRLWLPAAETV